MDVISYDLSTADGRKAAVIAIREFKTEEEAFWLFDLCCELLVAASASPQQ